MVKASKQSKKFSAKAAKNSSKHDNHKGKSMGRNMLEGKKRERVEVKTPSHSKKSRSNKTILTQTPKEIDSHIKNNDIDFLGEENLGDLNLEDFLTAITKDEVVGHEIEDENLEKEEEVEKRRPVKSSDNAREQSGDLNEDESDDEDIARAEQRMKDELRKLADKDPDFHKYLRDNESSLLNFDADDGDDDSSDVDVDEVMVQGNSHEETANHKLLLNEEIVDESRRVRLTAKLLSSYEQGAFRDHGIKSLKKIVSAYKSACHLSDLAFSEGEEKGKYIEFDSPLVSNRVLVLSLESCHIEFFHHLLANHETELYDADEKSNMIDPNTPIDPRVISKSPRCFEIQPIITSFFNATLHWLSEAKNPSLAAFVLKSLSHYIPYLSVFPRLANIYLKRLTILWSDSDDASVEYQSVRLNAFLRIRQLSITQPFPFIESCLKSCYLAYAKRAKFANAATISTLLPTITFMGNCCVELYSLDYVSSYQHAFIYIRQLALHLRNALQKRTPESFSVVYCWQYMHCLKLWVAVLAAACPASHEKKDDDSHLMRSLIYPLVEVILGTARLIPSVRFLPLRFHCVRLLQQLAASAELFIPTSSLLLEVLDLKELYLKPKSVSSRGKDVRGIRLAVLLKLPKVDTMRTIEQIDSSLGELFTLLNREVDLYRFSPGFPEFTFPITQRLRKFSKAVNNGRYRAYSRGCIDLCEKLAQSAVHARSHLNITPKDATRLEVLKSKDDPPMTQRFESSVAKEKRFDFGPVPQTTSSVVSGSDKYKGYDKDLELGVRASAKKSDDKVTSKKSTQLLISGKDRIAHSEIDVDDEVHDGFSWSEEDEEIDDDGQYGTAYEEDFD